MKQLKENHPTTFKITKDGVYSGDLWICSYLEIIADTRDENGTNWGRLLHFTDRDGQMHQWVLPMSLLAGEGASYREHLLSMGLQVSMDRKARDRLASYLQNYPITKRVRCVERIGWVKDCYVLHDKTFGRFENEEVIFQMPNRPIEKSIQCSGTLDEWKNNVASYCQNNTRLEFAVSLAFAGPLLIFRNEEGGFHLRGGSSVGKTTALFVSGSVWGGNNKKGYIQSWRATSNGIEAIAAEHCDGFLPLDELNQVDPKQAGEVAYLLANGSGKQRADKKGSAREKAQWRLLFLSSGEISLANHMLEAGKSVKSGQEIRMLDLPADAGKGLGLFETTHGIKDGDTFAKLLTDNSKKYYGTPIRVYLEKLTTAKETEFKFVQAISKKFIDNYLPRTSEGQVSRACGRFALVAAAGELAIRLGILPWREGRAIEASRICFNEWVNSRDGLGNSEGDKAINQVRLFLQMYGTSRFTCFDGAALIGNDMTPNRAGFRRPSADHTTTDWYVFPDVYKKELCKGFDPKFVTKVLINRSYLIPDSAGKSSCSINLPGLRKSRVYWIKSTIMESLEDCVPGDPGVPFQENLIKPEPNFESFNSNEPFL